MMTTKTLTGHENHPNRHHIKMDCCMKPCPSCNKKVKWWEQTEYGKDGTIHKRFFCCECDAKIGTKTLKPKN